VPNILYLLIGLALLMLFLPQLRRKKKNKPFDWSRRHTWWSRWRARGAFPNGR
jgi:hypothetical protein